MSETNEKRKRVVTRGTTYGAVRRNAPDPLAADRLQELVKLLLIQKLLDPPSGDTQVSLLYDCIESISANVSQGLIECGEDSVNISIGNSKEVTILLATNVVEAFLSCETLQISS